MEKSSQLDEKTKIPLGLAVGVTIFVCGMVLWAGRLEWVASATARALVVNIEERKQESEDLRTEVRNLSRKLLVLSCHLKVPDPDCPRR